MKNKFVKLKNLYSGEIVFTEDFNQISKVNDMEFIVVWNPNTPQRKYLVNRNSFKPLTK